MPDFDFPPRSDAGSPSAKGATRAIIQGCRFSEAKRGSKMHSRRRETLIIGLKGNCAATKVSWFASERLSSRRDVLSWWRIWQNFRKMVNFVNQLLNSYSFPLLLISSLLIYLIYWFTHFDSFIFFILSSYLKILDKLRERSLKHKISNINFLKTIIQILTNTLNF